MKPVFRIPPPAEELKSVLGYRHETGEFHWIKPTNRRIAAGAAAGALTDNGYLAITINGKKHLAHRLAWFVFYGTIPPEYIDHVNRIKTDNRISNLRLATMAQNAENREARSDNKSGFKGVSWCKNKKMWSAQIQRNGKNIHREFFTSKEDAAASYLKASAVIHGKFSLANSGTMPQKRTMNSSHSSVQA